MKQRNLKTGFPELLIQIGSVIDMPSVQMQLEAFGDELEFMPQSLGQNTSMLLGIKNFDPKGFGGSTNDLLNLRQRFQIYDPSPKNPREI